MHRSIATCSGHHFTHSTTPKFVQLLPSEIRYIRLSTSQRLSSGLHVTDLLKRCLCGNMDIEDLTHKNLEVMTVMKYGGYYWVTDGTKRLWVLKEMEKLSLCGKISVRVVTRRVHSLWDRLASTASNGQEIEFCCASDAERYGFEEKARNIIKEFERNGGRPFDLRPASSRFLWAAHPTTAQIMSKRIEDHLRNSGHYQWFRGPYNVERRFILGFFFLFFLISLSVLGKTLGDLEEAEGASK